MEGIEAVEIGGAGVAEDHQDDGQSHGGFSGRDGDGKLPCNLQEVVPVAYEDSPPMPVIPPPPIK